MTASQPACPACGRGVTEGVRFRGGTWHEDCAAQVLVSEAEAQAQAEQTSAARPARRKGSSCLVIALSVLFDFLVPVVGSAFMGALAGGLAGLYAGVMLWRDRPPWPLLALAAGALVGGAAGLAAGLRFFWHHGELYGFGEAAGSRAGRRSERGRLGGPK